jgi:hypothetical protein
MPRTTVDIAAPILREIKALQRKAGLPMGQIISRLLAEALKSSKLNRKRKPFRWTSRPMQALLDLTDKEAIYAVMERGGK